MPLWKTIYVYRSARCHLYNIGRIRKYLARDATEQLIHAFMTSKLDYGNALFCGLPVKQIKRLQRLQKIAARIVTLKRTSSHTTPVLHDLYWQYRQYSQYLSGLGSKSFFLCSSARTTWNLHSCKISSVLIIQQELYGPAGQSRLEVPITKTNSYGNRAFCVAGPRLWNELPAELRTVSSPTTFKSKLQG
ncbi:uncharacterized protein [Apostichopus japonicus]|uniref:uncharacterized protein n=1 Tax=Stichopus japonicus TaxID=307972 RepID=UPI003AB5C7E2